MKYEDGLDQFISDEFVHTFSKLSETLRSAFAIKVNLEARAAMNPAKYGESHTKAVELVERLTSIITVLNEDYIKFQESVQASKNDI